MKFLDEIMNETLIICKNSFKERVLELKRLIPIKFMGIDEFISKYYFSYDERAILYMMKKYGYKYEVAKMYLDNLYYIDDIKYGCEKLDFLVKIKQELENEGLLIYNDDFRKYISNVDVILYDIRMTKYLKRMLSSVKYRVIDREYHEYEHVIYSFKTMEEECEYVAYEICKLIDKGIDVNNIKLSNVDSSYYNTLERIFSLFNLRINIPYKAKLSSYEIASEFIKLYREKSLEEALSLIDENEAMYGEIIKIINKYRKYNDKELIIYKLENSNVMASSYDKGIDIINYLDYISNEDDYVFLMGFNDGIIPNSYKDVEYITDNLCGYVDKDTTRNKNIWLREDIIKNIKDIKNLVITYKDKDMSKSYYPSTLCGNFKVLVGNTEYHDSYSEKYNKIKLMSRYDDYIRYGTISDDFKLLYNNFKISYNSYSNKYTKVDRVMDKLTLSYSKMQVYNKCAFRYYLDEILKLNIFEENFSTVIGNMVHYVMERCLSNCDNDTDKYVSEYFGDREFSKKEQFFLKKYQEAIKDLLNQVLLEREYGLFNQAMYEKKIEINYGNNVKFVGIIDKVLYYVDDDKTYIALIDYKTGNALIDLKYLKYGLDIQLPIYLYLSTRLDFRNPIYVGFYLQKFNIKENDYRLQGYSNSDKDILKIIDNEYDNSKIIKGMKTNKDGSFYRYTKVVNNDEIENIKKETEEVILQTIEKIKNNDFEINPKVIDGKNKGCEFCKYSDICNVSKNDMVIIDTKDEEEY